VRLQARARGSRPMITATIIDYIPRSGKRKRSVALETITSTGDIVLVDFRADAFKLLYEREAGKLIGRKVMIGEDRRSVRFA
jgi:hypothetical protein